MREQSVAQRHEAATPVQLVTADILLGSTNYENSPCIQRL
jgi:hypothetical protein